MLLNDDSKISQLDNLLPVKKSKVRTSERPKNQVLVVGSRTAFIPKTNKEELDASK